MSLTIEKVTTEPFAGQKPGTSGLRKKVTEVKQENYLENFVQCMFDSLPKQELRNATLVVSGDGRYYNDVAIGKIIRMSAAAGVGRIITGLKGLMSTPCVSGVIRDRKAYGGIILTASHNPGGPTEDFGIKYNSSNGGPANEALTNAMFERSKTIDHYYITRESPQFDNNKVGEYKFGSLVVEVIDATVFYSQLMQKIFDFNLLKAFTTRKDFTFIYDTMHGVAGPFARRIFVDDLGASADSLLNESPEPDFGGGHPDPNLTYAHELVEKMGLGHEKPSGKVPDFGAASDGDADRNMILGANFFVTPSDSVAIIAANADALPYFKERPLTGVARSMPTSAALDRVAAKKGLKNFEVPTGWKFFGNLMDAGLISICGEESFGTGSDHIREKDGMWAILAWLSILAKRNEGRPEGQLLSVREIVEEHWKEYGRNYYSRYDYENVETDQADQVMKTLLSLVADVQSGKQEYTWGNYTVKSGEEFTYNDPVDKSVSANQGILLRFTDGSRIVYRLSGTGSVGATIRVYIERYEQNDLALETASALKELIDIALAISKMQEFTGRDKPTVIT